jgi:hypothetical protein
MMRPFCGAPASCPCRLLEQLSDLAFSAQPDLACLLLGFDVARLARRLMPALSI